MLEVHLVRNDASCSIHRPLTFSHDVAREFGEQPLAGRLPNQALLPGIDGVDGALNESLYQVCLSGELRPWFFIVCNHH